MSASAALPLVVPSAAVLTGPNMGFPGGSSNNLKVLANTDMGLAHPTLDEAALGGAGFIYRNGSRQPCLRLRELDFSFYEALSNPGL